MRASYAMEEISKLTSSVAPRVEVPRLDGIPRETRRRRRSCPGTGMARWCRRERNGDVLVLLDGYFRTMENHGYFR